MNTYLQIAIVSGTNREGAVSLKLSEDIKKMIQNKGQSATLLNLSKLPPELFYGKSYDAKPQSFSWWQECMNHANGVIFCVPEYNGGIPGILKYFLDMLSYPDSIKNKPILLVGLSAGTSGGINALVSLKQLMLFQKANVFAPNITIPKCGNTISSNGITDIDLRKEISNTIDRFINFSREHRSIYAEHMIS